MEFRARYELIGLFSLAVVLALFAFVYWLENVGGFGERTTYRVQFSVPVTGIAVGGGVFFNGIRVGEVTGLALDPGQPRLLEARIAIDATTPVHADTRVAIAHEGLTGVADIMLAGGAADAPPLAAAAGEAPLLVADPADTRAWTESAGRLLGRFDALLERNSDRFDSILAGLERMAGATGDKGGGVIYDLPAPEGLAATAKPPAFVLTVGEPSVPLALNTDKLLLQPAPGAWQPLADARLADNLPNLFQARLIQGFENAGYLSAVLRPADASDPDYRVLVDIRAFHVATDGAPRAVLDVVAKIVDREGKVVAASPFTATAPAASSQPDEAAAALARAFAEGAGKIIAWVGQTI